MNTEPLVTAEQVTLHFGVAKDIVYRWRERKKLPAHKIGRLWKFSSLRWMNGYALVVRMNTLTSTCSKNNKGEQC